MVKGMYYWLVDNEIQFILLYIASRHSIRPYVYIRPKDVLIRLPRFNYRSVTVNKQRDTIKGLLVLYGLLNLDYKDYHKSFSLDQQPQCGWAKTLRDAGGAYSNTLQVQKTEASPERSPPPIRDEDNCSEEEINQMFQLCDKISAMYVG